MCLSSGDLFRVHCKRLDVVVYRLLGLVPWNSEGGESFLSACAFICVSKVVFCCCSFAGVRLVLKMIVFLRRNSVTSLVSQEIRASWKNQLRQAQRRDAGRRLIRVLKVELP